MKIVHRFEWSHALRLGRGGLLAVLLCTLAMRSDLYAGFNEWTSIGPYGAGFLGGLRYTH